jgi:hypothetical protein
MAASFATWRVVLVMAMRVILATGRGAVHKKGPEGLQGPKRLDLEKPIVIMAAPSVLRQAHPGVHTGVVRCAGDH